MARRIYLDANILIYLQEGEGSRKEQAHSAITNHLDRNDKLFTSEITVGECLRGALRRSKELADNYRALLSNQDFISLHAVDLALISRAAEIGAQLNMKLIDCLHVATAETLGCAIFLTNDRGIRAPAGMEIRRLSE